VADTHVPDDIYDKARAEFSEQELVDLTMAVVTINAWNRLMVSFRIPHSRREHLSRTWSPYRALGSLYGFSRARDLLVWWKPFGASCRPEVVDQAERVRPWQQINGLSPAL
jgi:hypothetical protein